VQLFHHVNTGGYLHLTLEFARVTLAVLIKLGVLLLPTLETGQRQFLQPIGNKEDAQR
jgi:hypothetical protein